MTKKRLQPLSKEALKASKLKDDKQQEDKKKNR